MEPALRSGTSDDPAAPPARGGVVSRRVLFERLGRAGRITEVSAPAGGGKTFLLRCWIDEAGLAERAAWVPVQGEQRDPQRFWISVLDALRGTVPGSALVRPVTAAPDLDGWAVVERLLADLGSLADRIWLVIDDLHELGSAEALRQLELLLMRAPPSLRFLLTTRHDLRLGLHRLRLEGELTEIRAASLRFTLEEARALFEAAGVQLSDSALALLLERTEGWAAGLRLAALSLARHPDPERFAAEFSGSERTVAEYLMAEVLERQSEEVRRLLLRTSVLERVNGQLADLLTAGRGGGGSCWTWSRPMRSWSRWIRTGPGSVTTSCSRTCCTSNCGVPSRANWPPCTAPPPGGTPTTGTQSMRSATPRRRRTGTWPPACCRTNGSTLISTGRAPPRTNCSPGFPPTSSRPTLSSPR
jgi:LuxR family maltose regulon positive regulatory protein